MVDRQRLRIVRTILRRARLVLEICFEGENIRIPLNGPTNAIARRLRELNRPSCSVVSCSRRGGRSRRRSPNRNRNRLTYPPMGVLREACRDREPTTQECKDVRRCELIHVVLRLTQTAISNGRLAPSVPCNYVHRVVHNYRCNLARGSIEVNISCV